MLKPPRVGGADHLRLFVEELGFTWACQVIDVHPATMRAWLRGSRPVPAAAMQALYWLTSYGFSEACTEAHWSHQWLCYKVRELEGRLEAVRSAPREQLNLIDPQMGLLGPGSGDLGGHHGLTEVGADGGVDARGRDDLGDQEQHSGMLRVDRHFLPALL